MLIKDSKKTWIVCTQCGGAYDVRKGGQCKCKNVTATPLKDTEGAVFVFGEDSDTIVYDNEK